MHGDRAALSALVRNLADNALRYGREGGQVRLQVSAEADGPRLTVDDDGPGIPPAERERVFDRFWRRDSGRADGTGLGLAIAQAVAQRHGGQITLADSPLGGLRVQVRLSAGPGPPRPNLRFIFASRRPHRLAHHGSHALEPRFHERSGVPAMSTTKTLTTVVVTAAATTALVAAGSAGAIDFKHLFSGDSKTPVATAAAAAVVPAAPVAPLPPARCRTTAPSSSRPARPWSA
jgi:hypothetical protein